MNIRAIAANIIVEVAIKKHSLTDSLAKHFEDISDARDKSLLQAICFGVCRYYFQLEIIAKSLLAKTPKDEFIFHLLLVGLYQLKYMSIPAHAAIFETVNAAANYKNGWAKGLINAVLRNYQRKASEFAAIHHAHPKWLIEKIKLDWPHEWETILTANNEQPPFSLRVNKKQISREAYLENTPGKIIAETSCGIILDQATDVKSLNGFAEGKVSVQDGAAQLAAELLQLQSENLVLDACAAPGGKAAHILEISDVKLIAIDQDETRLQRIKENLLRLKLSATCIVADAAATHTWWDGIPFDRILLDAPCSGSGVIRRHPDIKLLRRFSDIQNFSKEQYRLLDALWPLLKKDGLLVYATCSIFPEENVEILQRFLHHHQDAKEEKILSHWGRNCAVGKQILPGMHNMDGFYYGCLRKSA